MLVRAFCHNWHRQISLPAPSILRPSPNLLLHHARHRFPTRSMRSTKMRAHPPRSPMLQTTPFDQFAIGNGGQVPISNVWKAIVFTGTFSVGCFMAATVLEYENARHMMLERARKSKFPWMRKKQANETGYWANVKRDLMAMWEQLTPGEKVFAPLCALNLVVFMLWRVPAMKNIMTTYFCSNPAARVVCWPMFLSTFSHYSLFHIFANMYVLHSFSNAAVLSLGKEQFLAVYLSAGVIASLTSIVYKAITSQAGLSLGASGAIMAILGFVCAQYPDTQLSILFLPMLTFSAGSAIKVILGIDLAGCLLGWKIFDHAAHLGGALFGIFWAYNGIDVWKHRITFLTKYHDWRKSIS